MLMTTLPVYDFDDQGLAFILLAMLRVTIAASAMALDKVQGLAEIKSRSRED